MSNANDPAFVQPLWANDNAREVHLEVSCAPGLTKREWFAGQVAAGLLPYLVDLGLRANEEDPSGAAAGKMLDIAGPTVVHFADAILARLEETDA